MIARLRGLIRRGGTASQADAGSVLVVGDLTLDEDSHEVHRAGEEITLTATEFELLRFLMRNPRRVQSKAQILDRVWQYDFGGQANVVELYISYLRKKVDAGRADDPHDARCWLRPEAGAVMRLPRLPRLRPLALTARLVAVAVMLVAASAAVLGTATVLVMQDYFSDRLDDEVRSSLYRGFGPPVDDGPRPRDDVRGPGGQRVGTLTAGLTSIAGRSYGSVVADASRGGVDEQAVSAEVLDRLADLPADGRIREIDLPDLGTYRVMAVGDDPTSVAGLPTDEVDEALAWLVTIVVAVGAGAVALAGAAGTLVVRRQLAPLREVAATAHRVAELPLGSGDIEMAERVPARLTDERTEVGQVGSALNAMLDHVEDSLGQRHRSEQQVRQFVATPGTSSVRPSRPSPATPSSPATAPRPVGPRSTRSRPRRRA